MMKDGGVDEVDDPLREHGQGSTLSGYACLAVIDRTTHALRQELELSEEPVDVTRARAALGRPPQVDGSDMISWGRVSLHEAEAIVGLETNPDTRRELLAQLQALPRPGKDLVIWCLHFCTELH